MEFKDVREYKAVGGFGIFFRVKIKDTTWSQLTEEECQEHLAWLREKENNYE